MPDQKLFIYPDGRLDVENTSLYLGMRPKTLAMWRCKGIGPQFVKLGGRIFYFKEDLDTWLQQFKFRSTLEGRVVMIKGGF